MTKAEFIEFSAVLAGIKEIKQVMADAERARQYGTRTIVFIDEIHRFNKAQQDAFLPHVEKGNIRLIGATTENPSFEINAALLSRCPRLCAAAADEDQIVQLLRRALTDEDRGLGDDEVAARPTMCSRKSPAIPAATRAAPTTCWKWQPGWQQQAGTQPPEITDDIVRDALQKRILLYDKAGEEHYNLISALHKSVRNSDPDAALYWLGRMIEAGEDPLYIARRVVRMAVEDIGLADPNALSLCMAARDAVDFIGMPEGNLALHKPSSIFRVAPKSNALYTAYGAFSRTSKQTAAEPVPLHLRNAPTGLMKDLGYGKDYQYAHDVEGKVADMQCLPDNCGIASITSQPMLPPKPMVPIGKRPILWHIMKTYAHYGHKDFILCLGYKGDMIKDYFRNYLWNTCDVTLRLGASPRSSSTTSHDEEDWTVTLADTGENSMTAYRIRLIQNTSATTTHFSSPTAMASAISISTARSSSIEKSGQICAMTAVHPPGRFGELGLDERGRVHGFNEKPQAEGGYINGGLAIR